MRKVTDVSALESLFLRDPDVHLYGLPDLEEPFWSPSTWWMEGEATVGFVRFPGSEGLTAYAMSATAPEASLELLARVVDRLPGGTLVTGPTGLAERVAGERSFTDLGRHWRLIHDGRLLAPPPGVAVLSIDDLDDLHALHRTDPGAAFFLPHMLETGVFVGMWEDERLVASAGTHVISDRFGVAAVGAVLTDPQERGRGLGAAATEGLMTRLVPRFATVGLNVAESNPGALRLYERLGFVRRFSYEEVELL